MLEEGYGTLRRIIYNSLNVYPFDYTAFVVSRKVNRKPV